MLHINSVNFVIEEDALPANPGKDNTGNRKKIIWTVLETIPLVKFSADLK